MKVKRILSILFVLMILTNTIGCSFDSAKEKASSAAYTVGTVAGNAKETVTDTANAAKDKVVDWYSNLDLSKFEDGWEYSKEFMAANYSALMTSEFMNSQYVTNLESAISTLKADMNASMGSARGTAQEAGFLAEKWATDTFNIDAIAKGSPERATTVGSTGLGSVDVSTTYGENAQLKYYQTASGSASAQAENIMKAYHEYASNTPGEPISLKEYVDNHGYSMAHDELFESLYKGQTRIIPTDQLDASKQFLKGQINKLPPLGCGDLTDAQIKAYQETMENLSDRLRSPDGVQSKPLTYNELQAIAEVSKDGTFKPEDFGITLSSVIGPKYIVKQAMGTGVEVAAIKVALTTGPDVYAILKEAIQTGNIDEEALKETGVEGAVAGSEGFVEGSVSRLIATLCETGAFGDILKSADPSIIATLAVITIEAAIQGYELAQGNITPEEYGNTMVDRINIAFLSIPISGLILSVLPRYKIVMLAGCMAGSMLACVGYSVLKEARLDLIDGGGFEAIVPVEAASTFSVAKDKIASLNIKESLSSFKDSVVSTANDGYIKVSTLVK